ncbi:MAG TPA: ComEC/Rec2 family competence protein, partial [Bacillota bacterium]|nr:ComEC/Rec2 family competence protein [Bacillota bacterium]
MKRPLVAVALCYGGGLLMAEWIQPPLGLLFALALSLAAGALFWSKGRGWLVWPLLVFTGWTNLVWHTGIVSPHDLRITQTNSAELVTVRGRLPETPSQRIFVQDEKESTRSLAQLEVSHLLHKGTQWQPAFGRILVITPDKLPPDYFAGQLVEVCGALAPPPGPQAEGLFDYRAYLRRQGIYYQLKTAGTHDWSLLSTNRTPPLADRFLAWAQTTLARGLPVEDESLRLLWAMTLGWKTGLTNEIYEPFMRSGTMHIFA